MSAYVDENGLLIDDEGNPVEEPVDAWAVRESLQDAQRWAYGSPTGTLQQIRSA